MHTPPARQSEPGVGQGSSGPDSGPDPAPDSGQDEAGELLELLHLASHRLRRQDVSENQRPGTTPGQLRLLRLLAHARGPVRAADVAARLDMAPRSVTSKVDQAEADGYVRRVPDPGDRRARLLELTDAGREVVETQWRRRRAGIAGRLDRLSPVERAMLLQLLRVVVEDERRRDPSGPDPAT